MYKHPFIKVLKKAYSKRRSQDGLKALNELFQFESIEEIHVGLAEGKAGRLAVLWSKLFPKERFDLVHAVIKSHCEYILQWALLYPDDRHLVRDGLKSEQHALQWAHQWPQDAGLIKHLIVSPDMCYKWNTRMPHETVQ